MGRIKRFMLWEHSRETSVYVVFCLFIVAFIFLTPRAWFDNRERLATQTSRLIVQASDFPAERDAQEAQVRELSGNPGATIVETRQRTRPNGETVYEIEIR